MGGLRALRTTYDEVDDILTIHLSDKKIAKEVSQDWNTHISYADDGSIVEVIVLDAEKNGAWPLVRTVRRDPRFASIVGERFIK